MTSASYLVSQAASASYLVSQAASASYLVSQAASGKSFKILDSFAVWATNSDSVVFAILTQICLEPYIQVNLLNF